MPEFSPEVFPRLTGELIEATNVAVRTSLARICTAVQRRARDKLSENTHQYGTPTTATPGGPPALVTGTLRRSVVHTEPRPTFLPGTWEAKVGLAAGIYPPSHGGRQGRDSAGRFTGKSGGDSSKTPSSKYGLYLETVTGYPWFIPAFRETMSSDAPRIWREAFGSAPWPHIR